MRHMNYYNLKEKNLIIQGYKITIIMMSLIITISSIILFLYFIWIYLLMTKMVSTYHKSFKNSFRVKAGL